jgi:hypothetical protein
METKPVETRLVIMSPTSRFLDDAIFVVSTRDAFFPIREGDVLDTALYYSKPDWPLLRVTKVHHMLLDGHDSVVHQVFVFTSADVGDETPAEH